jgi:hypothetical protein
MNERIKELAGKALDKAVPYTWTQLDYDQIQELLACHAELIIEECVRVCNKQTPNWKGEYATAFGDGIEFCISGIKKHFGVEE